MPQLVEPDVAYHRSFVAAIAEEPDFIGWRIDRAQQLERAEVFAWYVEKIREDGDEASPRPPGLVPSTTLWWVDHDGREPEYLGRVSIRHRLTRDLLHVGGHVGYWIRPSARRRGHATAALAAALPVAASLGLDPVLLTCDRDNVASRKVIEAAGGVPDAPYGIKLRYWVPTGARPDLAADGRRQPTA